MQQCRSYWLVKQTGWHCGEGNASENDSLNDSATFNELQTETMTMRYYIPVFSHFDILTAFLCHHIEELYTFKNVQFYCATLYYYYYSIDQ